tara:strand:- start:1719 stop:3119 length:1401 start_codon:yes stop_codon:yes gene_type:complete
MNKIKASIVIRTKNEERWIPYCLEAVLSQEKISKEIIVIDDNSVDKTIEIVEKFPVKLFFYKGEYLPGKVLNFGVSKCSGEFVVFLSGHCVPKNPNWLFNLLKPFSKYRKLAGVYGRQEPFNFTSDTNKRDLWNTFGLDSKLQIKDSFFHNANSCVPRLLLEKYPFDENVTNIEDRLWSTNRIKEGFKIFYNSEASVYHWHGINQDNNKERLSGVVRILEEKNLIFPKIHNNKKQLPETAIIPSLNPMQYDSKMFLLKKTIQDLRHSKYIKKIILLLGPEVEKSLFKDIDVDKIITRPKYLSSPILGQWPSIAYSLDGEKNINDKSFLILQENYPFRNHEQIDKLIKFYEKSSSKVVMYGQKIRNTIFEKKHDKLKPIGLPFIPKILSKQDYFSALKGFSMIADAKTLTKEISIHEDFEILDLEDQFSIIQINSQKDFNLYIKNSLTKKNISKYSFSTNPLLKNVI